MAGPAVCPVCAGQDTETLVELEGLPVFCNVQYDSPEDAREQPAGDLSLALCRSCAHLFNCTFNPALLSYDQAYENSLHFSAVFNRFARELAEGLVERHDLRGKRVLDIGCGKGDFLSLVCELGANEGFGFDRSYEEGRGASPSRGSVRYFNAFFDSEHAGLRPDLVTCRHVLEHIVEPLPFLTEIAEAVADPGHCRFYLEVPNALFTVRDLGIWDLIYEHCQYFTAPSLVAGSARAGIAVDRIEESFGGQYLGFDGRLATSGEEPDVAAVLQTARSFPSAFQEKVKRWRGEMDRLGRPAAVWGGGSKGVTFLNILGLGDEVSCVIDVNPHKQGKYVPLTGHPIEAPESLRERQPETVLVMNPLYRDEIAAQLSELGLKPRISVVD